MGSSFLSFVLPPNLPLHHACQGQEVMELVVPLVRGEASRVTAHSLLQHDSIWCPSAFAYPSSSASIYSSTFNIGFLNIYYVPGGPGLSSWVIMESKINMTAVFMKAPAACLTLPFWDCRDLKVRMSQPLFPNSPILKGSPFQFLPLSLPSCSSRDPEIQEFRVRFLLFPHPQRPIYRLVLSMVPPG